MESSLYGDFTQQLEYLIASGKPDVHCVTTKSSRVGTQFVSAGLYHEEESVDFSALVEACELNSGSPHLTTAESANFLDSSETAFPFEVDLLPTTSSAAPLAMFGSDNGTNAPLDLTLTGPLNPQVTQSATVIEMPARLLATTTDLSMVNKQSPQSLPKCGTKRKLPQKGSHEYREKRDRNNLAVKKSRSKSKQRIKETEERVKELEDENARLQNKIALLSKELNVLKSLFSSAGVPQPRSLKVEVAPTMEPASLDE